ncbi:radical SAM protein [Candidatus Micrarchaeota archaeon]|nr:radical SAM protein [Candidatus Micrarchaeota archaeon]
MKVALIQPELDEFYSSQRQAYGSITRPPETGLAVLIAWAKKYCKEKHEFIALNPNKRFNEIIEKASKNDLIGFSDWYTNHWNCIKLAKRIKERNRNAIIVFAGPNASCIPQLILLNHSFIDFVVVRDGEIAFQKLLDKELPSKISNLWYRKKGKIFFTKQEFTDLNKIPLWDFEEFEDKELRLEKYLESQKNLDPWIEPPIALYSFRGCVKAVKEGECSYCTSYEKTPRILEEENFWNQAKHLTELYEAKRFYIADDIFTVSFERIKKLAEAKPKDLNVQIRAYSYLPYLAGLEKEKLGELARNLKKIGIFNLFFGIESFDEKVLRKSNKRNLPLKKIIEIINLLWEYGNVSATVAVMVGLPGESKKSLEKNKKAVTRLLDECSEAFARLYLSACVPLRGTRLFKELLNSEEIRKIYFNKTKKGLSKDDYPDYSLLAALLVDNFTEISMDEVNNYLKELTLMASKKIPPHRIGGFLSEIPEKTDSLNSFKEK